MALAQSLGPGGTQPGNINRPPPARQPGRDPGVRLDVGDHPFEIPGVHPCNRDLGHSRWDIENQGFNEAANQWHSNHVYRHHPIAIPAFWLLTMLVINVFRAFYLRNLKPQRHRYSSMLHVARCLTAELYKGMGEHLLPIPT